MKHEGLCYQKKCKCGDIMLTRQVLSSFGELNFLNFGVKFSSVKVVEMVDLFGSFFKILVLVII